MNLLRDNLRQRSQEDRGHSGVDSDYLGEWIPEEKRRPSNNNADHEEEEDIQIQTDERLGDVYPENNARETVTVIQNGVPMTYWVWGRPMMNKPLNKPANVIVLYEADTP